MRYAWEIVVRLRPMLIVAALAFAILAVPSQMLELYLIDIETVAAERLKFRQPRPDEPPQTILRFLINIYTIWCAMLSGLGAMIVMWLAAAHLICLVPERHLWSRRRRWMASGLIVLIALSPVLGVLSGLGNVVANLPQIVSGSPSADSVAAALRADLWIYMGITVALAAIGVLPFALMTFTRLDTVARIGQKVFAGPGVVVGIAVVLAFTATLVIWPTVVPWYVGTQALVYLFLAALAFVLTWFSHLYRVTGWPVTVLVMAAAFVFSMLGINDNHKVEHKVVAVANNTLEKNLEQWLLSRADRQWFAEQRKPYPVYVVSAEGGGMFAGYHAAAWLGNMQDNCPRFAQHVFAISSVSGGSLGAAVFAALTKGAARNREFGPCASRSRHFSWTAERYFRNDLLAPLVGATLFPDFIQRLLPWPMKSLDRAGALEEAFSQAWDRSSPGNDLDGLFKRPLHALWDPKGATPALFLNTTSVLAGSRVTISPLQLQQTPTAVHLNTTLCLEYSRHQSVVDLPVATAVSLSARFPWLTPAGWLDLSGTSCPDKRERDRVYLVDGGYFENSGLETALDIVGYMHLALDGDYGSQRGGVDMQALRREYPYGLDIKIIMIFAVDQAAERYARASAERSSARPGELVPPVQTMLAGRAARTRAVHLATVEEGRIPNSRFGGGHSRSYSITPRSDAVRVGQDAVHQVWLDGAKFFLPLGWRLSNRSADTIEGSARASAAARMIERELMGLDSDDLKGRAPKAPPSGSKK